MLLFPPFLGEAPVSSEKALQGALSFIVFALAASAGYIANDLMDRHADRSHPSKLSRPLAAGVISVVLARLMSVVLAVTALVLAFSINSRFADVVAAYLAVSVAYSCYLKNLPVVDLFCIAAGFLFRLMAGGIIFDVKISEWLFMSVFLLSLFLSAGKRFSEKQLLNFSAAASHRKVLAHYPDGFLDGILFMTGSAVLVTYTMYTLSHRILLYTVPLCCFGLMRYIFRIKTGNNGDPTEALLHDPWLFAVGFGWSIMVGWGIYVK